MEGWGLEVVGRVDGWGVLGKAVWAETEPRSHILIIYNLTTKSGDTAAASADPGIH